MFTLKVTVIVNICMLLSIGSYYVTVVSISFFWLIKRGCFNGLGESVMQQQDSLLPCELHELASLGASREHSAIDQVIILKVGILTVIAAKDSG